MPFHRHHHHRNDRHHITLGITSGNIARLRSGPIPFVAGPLRCVLRTDDHALPHPEAFAVTLAPDDVRRLLDEGLVEFVGIRVSVVCVFGRTPVEAGEAVQKVVGDA